MAKTENAVRRRRAVPEPGRRDRFSRKPNRLLVASTGEPSSLGAIRVALTLARQTRASIHALTVATIFPRVAPSPFRVAPPILVDEDNRRLALEKTRRQLAAIRGTREWSLTAVEGWPPERIIEAAKHWDVSLIIVGIGEHGRMDRLIGSETAVKIAQRSPIPVLAVPEDARALATSAAAAIDFTDSSISAARLAMSLLAPDGVLTLVHASILVNEDAEPGSLPDVYTTGASHKLDVIRRLLQRETKRRIRTHLASGEVVDELLSYVESERCDLLAVGGHDQGFVDRLLLGSVRKKVLRHARCQVLVAPHAPQTV